LLPFGEKNFLLPTIAIEKVFLLEEYSAPASTSAPFCFGTMQWKTATIPIITMDLTAATSYATIASPKVALIHANFSLLFDKKVQQVTITPDNIEWIEQADRRALLDQGDKKSEVIIVDIYALSRAVENSLLRSQG
jgi:hypothetical protein